ncbi:hypothetical protein EDD37DRAFT_654177 [Exophiala viscosa]|uniref:ABM domain-containing protein n=1 Tax=Exophiala viscosa TaxID=2486360 RepID=A0AAN6DLF5_9EURO|nr:hypothetical protein EDD36DRAFT_469589 [Exophiala viscosa]KAI1620067.1 hypothetical protein EDD37DRAFT_654177 [Exophiala viscosa]
MAVLLLPVVPIGTEKNQQRFLSLLHSVAEETWKEEPDCLGYCWLRSASPADLRVCGFEMYSNPSALTETHRAGSAYGRFKDALKNERLAPPPSPDDLRFWYPVPGTLQELTKSHGEDTPLTFLVSKYHLDTSERRDALLKELGSAHGRSQTTAATRIVATTPDCHDVVTVQIVRSTETAVLVAKMEAEESRTREIGVSVTCDLWRTSSVGFLRGNVHKGN